VPRVLCASLRSVTHAEKTGRPCHGGAPGRGGPHAEGRHGGRLEPHGAVASRACLARLIGEALELERRRDAACGVVEAEARVLGEPERGFSAPGRKDRDGARFSRVGGRVLGGSLVNGPHRVVPAGRLKRERWGTVPTSATSKGTSQDSFVASALVSTQTSVGVTSIGKRSISPSVCAPAHASSAAWVARSLESTTSGSIARQAATTGVSAPAASHRRTIHAPRGETTWWPLPARACGRSA
jgi:hypothetical protein